MNGVGVVKLRAPLPSVCNTWPEVPSEEGKERASPPDAAYLDGAPNALPTLRGEAAVMAPSAAIIRAVELALELIPA